MRKLFLLTLVIFILPHVSFAASNAVTAESKITSVTVYPSTAMVTRQARVELPPGESEVVIGDLPGELQEDSVVVKGRGGKGARLGTVEARREYIGVEQNPELKKLEDRLVELRDQLKVVDDETGVYESQRKFYSDIQFHNAEVWSREITIGSPDAQSWRGLADFLRDGQLGSAETVRGLGIRKRELQNDINTAQNRINELRRAGSKSRMGLSVGVTVESGGPVELEVSYAVPGAYWTPAYEARVDVDMGKVELVSQAVVRQSTSEDWDGVELYLSTARPAVGASPPELGPWHVGTISPRKFEDKAMMTNQAFGAARAPGMLLEEQMAYDSESEPLEAVATSVAGASMQGGYAVYEAIGRKDIPADGGSHKVALSVREMDSEFMYFAVPKLSPYAYMKGVMTNAGEYPLLAGGVSVFMGEDYIGKSRMDYVAPGEKFELALGVDEGIKVKRERLKFFEEDSGILDKKRRLVYTYRITLENFKPKAQRITVLDQLPVSSQEEVVVKELSIEPRPTEREEQGYLKWRMELEPRQKQEIDFSFSVDFPKDAEITGVY